MTNNSNSNNNNILLKEISKSKNKELKDLFPYGFGIHHAGMLRSDRRLVERCFLEGSIKVIIFFLKKKNFLKGTLLYCHFSLGCKFTSSYRNY